jgi:hypothetical protein
LARALVWLNLLALGGIGVWFRVWQLGSVPGINGDEAWYGIEAMRLLAGEPIQWRTPTNNPLNLLYFGPLVLLHLLAEPSPALLRGAALASGLAALPAAFWLGRKAFGVQHAVIATVVVAVLPVNIAYSRFGWDASQTLLATLPVAYLPLAAMAEVERRQRWLIAAAVCLLAAMWVHPTNIFAAPMVALPALVMWRDELATSWRGQSLGRRWGIVAGAATSAAVVGALSRHWLLAVLERLADPAQFGRFLIHYHRLFTGTTVYRYIAGSAWADDPWTSLPQWDLMLTDLAAWGVSLVALVTVGRHAWHNRSSRDGALLLAWGVMVVGFYLVAGIGAIQPHFERYSLCLLAPGVAVLARAVELHCRRVNAISSPALVAGLAASWLLLLGFGSHYFDCFYQTGGRSHDTFRSAEVEPKAAALAQILAASPTEATIWIATSEYWNDRPLAYLASSHSRVRVTSPEQFWQVAAHQAAMDEGRLWQVEFAGSPAYRDVIERLDAQRIAYDERFILDFAGRPALALLRLIGRKHQPDEIARQRRIAGKLQRN